MSPGSGKQCKVTQAGGGWRRQGSFLALLGCLSEDVGPALPDIQQTWKSAFRHEMKVKVKSFIQV